MPARKQWDEEDDESSTPPSSPPLGAVRRSKFDDEEGDDSDVLDSWDAAEDSEVEREKAKKAAEAKAKAEAEAAANKKSKAQRIAEHKAERARQLAESDESDEDESEGERRERMRLTEKESDLKHAQDLFGDAGISLSNGRKATTVGSAIPVDPRDPTKTIDLGSLSLFNPQTKLQFENMRNTLVPMIGNNHKKAHYTLFLQEFTKQLAKELPSDQIKKIASTLTTLSNEKMKEEKAAEKGGKKTKAQKTKTTLVSSRSNTADVGAYDDDFGDDDFM
ncbi:eukaryotic translation initiation factor 3 subunit J [Hypoxylon sp. NC1633]|nr:eukaryotic translation initiation factor 3 subunit J [Hypoxylon sp. NC1633]